MSMMHGNGWDHMGSWGWAGMLAMLLFWVGFVALIVWVLRGWGAGNGPASPAGRPGDPALMILRERFARGEISAEEFDRARQTLEASVHGPSPT
jgi:putative membrane protein